MSIGPSAPRGPGRPQRDSGDAWTTAPDGQRYWGRFGAAGLLAFDPQRGVLLQHRADWSHHGGTWALPGGARHRNESATDAALREAAEEAGVPRASIRPRMMSVLDLDVWTYSTLLGDVAQAFEPAISDPESLALEWVPVPQVTSFPLHPAFARSWPRLQALLQIRPTVVVDAANVIGSVPDGWWKDRAGAAARLLAAVGEVQARGIPGQVLGLGEELWFPGFAVVVEGEARAVAEPELPVRVVRAKGSGDDAVALLAKELAGSGHRVTVATSDRELAGRSRRAGATVIGAGLFRELLGY